MDERILLKALFSDTRASRTALLAEHIVSIDNYLSVTEEALNEVQWVDKKGNYEPMIPSQYVADIVQKREMYLIGIGDDERKEVIIRKATSLLHLPVLKSILSFFTPTTSKALAVAMEIGDIENFNSISENQTQLLQQLSQMEINNIVLLRSQVASWNYESLKSLYNQVDIFVDSIIFLGKIHGIQSSAVSVKSIKKHVFMHWKSSDFDIAELNQIFITSINGFSSPEGQRIITRIGVLLELRDSYLELCMLFLKEVLKMEESVPRIAELAITTGNPFLFRSLFLSFKEAQIFAVGGKLNSSLETKYGNLFEKLMSAFNNCRGIYDGGMDVAVDNDSFDIKSGPNVMNSSQVSAFSAKQQLIDEGLLPGINTYRIALGYGKAEQLNSFMARIDSQILTGRDAWTTVTGKSHSPEIVYSIASLCARIFGFDSLVSSMLGTGKDYRSTLDDDTQFKEFFNSAFTRIELTADQEAEIDFIDNLLSGNN